MEKDTLHTEYKESDLIKYRDLIIATIDYYIENQIMIVNTSDFNSKEYFESLKSQTEIDFKKKRLSKLKQWFRDLTEPQIDNRDWNFNSYLQKRTGFDINIFEKFEKQIEKILAKGKITTDNQYYDIKNEVDRLWHAEGLNVQKIDSLNKLLIDFEIRKKK